MKSILSAKNFEKYVEDAKEEFEKHGEVDPPICFFNLGDKVLPVTVGQLFAEYDKRWVMSMFKEFFKETEEREIEEVIMIMESWFVRSKKADIGMRPSQHPDRQEAVVILGRDKTGKKRASVMFIIDPITRKLKIDKKLSKANSFGGIIDYVFNEDEARLKEFADLKKGKKN